MSRIDEILQRAEVLFWENQTYFHPKHGFLPYEQYHAVADALEEVLPGWKAFEEFLAKFGELHDEVLGSDINTVFVEGKDWTPSAAEIADALHNERQRLQYTLSHSLCHRIEGFSAAIHDRVQTIRPATRSLAANTAG